MYPSLLHRSKSLSEQLRPRVFIRLMGGGPRTFPGGLNKWQWKRLHEKKAKEKEKRLLDQEKQLYQARMRSQIRSKLAGQPDPDPDPSKFNPMSPKEHIKALADRFMKEGAEDLWNETDGPLKAPSDERPRFVGTNQRPGSINSPLDLRKLVSEGRNVSRNREENGFDYVKNRDYSTRRDLNSGSGGVSVKPLVRKQKKFKINESSSSDDDEDYEVVNDKVVSFGRDSGNERGAVRNSRNVSEFMKNKGFETQKQRRFERNESDDLEGGGERRGSRAKEIGSIAALGKFGLKKTRKVSVKELVNNDFANGVELIRYELGRKKKLAGNDGENEDEDSILGDKRFDECGLSPLTVKALTAAGYVQMTRVQEATLSVCLEGKDAMVKAKTGKGKSAAYLLPAIEAVLKARSSIAKQRVSPIYVLIICPTRELACQIAAEANAMLKYHDGIGMQTLVGGTRIKDDQRCLESDPCQILVATPGRLLDHIENKSGLSSHLMGLKMLILDEADHLLDLGFRKDVEKIVDCLPRQRQSLLFTATISKEVHRISQLVLKRERDFINTVGVSCMDIPAKIKQSFLVSPHELHFQVVHYLLKEHILKAPDYKVIVFCTTGMVTLMYLLLREMKINVREMHSRKPQLHRTHVSDEFQELKSLVLVASDVSAHGMNYPDVTLVIQVGVPYDREQYIHRLGRTGHEGKDGEGILLLAPWEEYFLDELKDLPLDKFPLPKMDSETKLKMEESMSKIDSSVKEEAYYAWLGYYNSIREIGSDKTMLVDLANRFSESIGFQKPPSLCRKTALKMGLKDIPGIRIRR
ncbi:DEAD-BOX ATP-DEPENDENT RNA HELICASE 33-RELATED [Salix purpurea]|uniref:ATP-dependent RNA helicase n=1 Tax=Salix purpurea TaxID=77065 RepID=A0A9Q0YW97_SALPP|nr:DEAD-BOX ATP-DEPENDENT RNA HELICASE 33-RELATED [Salix purpurea]